jgi:hypothetical protein
VKKNMVKKNGFPSIACDGGVAGAAERTDGVVASQFENLTPT